MPDFIKIVRLSYKNEVLNNKKQYIKKSVEEENKGWFKKIIPLHLYDINE